MVRPAMQAAYAIAALTAALIPTGAAAACGDLLPKPAKQVAAHLVEPLDLARLRDVGPPEVLTYYPSPLAISPDGRRLAFVLSRADPATDTYCRGLVVLDLAGGQSPRLVDTGGTMITAVDPFRGYLEPDGAPVAIVPAWSPDGRAIAYLRRDTGPTQLWVAGADGSGARAVTYSSVDVESFAWTPSGEALVYGSKLSLAVAARAIDAAGRSGWLYDAAISPNNGVRPELAAGAPTEYRVVTLASLAENPASASEQRQVREDGPATIILPDGRKAYMKPIDARPFGKTELVVGEGPSTAVCSSSACSGGVFALLWDAARREILFLRHEGANNEITGLYAWSPEHGGSPRRVLATSDAISGCTIMPASLICLRENATTPRRVVAIDPRSGRSRTVFDPNPEAAHWRLGRVQRLRWTNDYGLPAWGDLVLPPDYDPTRKIPMVVVQYISDGFLRGGTGDEYPIYALAARGIAVLSLERSAFYAQSVPGLASWDAFTVANQSNWSERRNQLSSLEHGVRAALATGAIDAQKMGVSGLSDGSSTVRFALINAPGLFHAAAISTCCVDMRTTMSYGGIAWADSLRAVGYPPATAEDEKFWQPYSFVLNAKRLTTPILMQVADSELLLSLESVTALRENHQPFEMYVFPDEFHIKWHPAHRLAIYRRNVDWFAYWLLGEKSDDPTRSAEYARWDAMRAPSPGTARAGP